MQQNQPGHGQLRLAVLRPRTQHPEKDAQRALQLQVPLVLLRALRGVPSHGVGQCVQVALPVPGWPFAHAGIKTVSLSRRPPHVGLISSLWVPWRICFFSPFGFHLSSGSCFPLRRCYSDNAKSEIKEVNHVIHPALVCLDLTPFSAMKKSQDPFYFFKCHKKNKDEQQQKSLFPHYRHI